MLSDFVLAVGRDVDDHDPLLGRRLDIDCVQADPVLTQRDARLSEVHDDIPGDRRILIDHDVRVANDLEDVLLSLAVIRQHLDPNAFQDRPLDCHVRKVIVCDNNPSSAQIGLFPFSSFDAGQDVPALQDDPYRGLPSNPFERHAQRLRD